MTNTVTKYTISDAANLYKKSRATIYKDIKNGILSRDNTGLLDFSELLRVYGEPFGKNTQKRINTSAIQKQNISEYISENTDKIVQELKNQLEFFKRQLEKAEDREAKANERIDTLLTLIEMKPTNSFNNEDPLKNKDKEEIDISSDPYIATFSDPKQINDSHQILEEEKVNNQKLQPKKRSLFGRVLNAVFDNE